MRPEAARQHVLRWLDPGPPRRIPRERAWNVAFRTVHIGAFGILLGGHFWGVEPERLHPALAVAVASGAALAGLELCKGLEWLFLVKGLVVLAKCVLLLSVVVFWDARLPLLFAILALASIGAHMPARYRNYSVLARRVLDWGPGLRPLPADATPVITLTPGRRVP